jgi:hypothetical protein
MIHPIVDEYYNHSPSYSRSANFAKEQGLVSNGPGAAQAITPMGINTPDARPFDEDKSIEAVRRRVAEVEQISARG